MSMNELLTIVIPVKNEERNLPGCLENVKAFEHVVVVDSGSTDRTVGIAAEFGRGVVQVTWTGECQKKRNWRLRNYRFETPWVMFLDADERITAAFCEELDKILPTTTCNARCFYCFEQGMEYRKMSRKTVEDVLRFILEHKPKEHKKIHIHWFGGEPMCAADNIDRICDGLDEAGIEYTAEMTSNGSLFDEESVKKASEKWKVGDTNGFAANGSISKPVPISLSPETMLFLPGPAVPIRIMLLSLNTVPGMLRVQHRFML